jgi:hypothetical protein
VTRKVGNLVVLYGKVHSFDLALTIYFLVLSFDV